MTKITGVAQNENLNQSIEQIAEEKKEQKNPKLDQSLLGGIWNYMRGIQEDHVPAAGNQPQTLKEIVKMNNELRIQGCIHALCLLLNGISNYLCISLPYPIYLSKAGGQGFVIQHSSSGQVLGFSVPSYSYSRSVSWRSKI